MSTDHGKPVIRPMYASAIHGCIAEGNVGKMKGLLSEAEKFVADHGDVRAAIEVLKAEISKAEAGRK